MGFVENRKFTKSFLNQVKIEKFEAIGNEQPRKVSKPAARIGGIETFVKKQVKI